VSVNPLLDRILKHPSIGRMVVHHQWIPPSPARFARPEHPIPESLASALAVSGIQDLYSHQAEALDAAWSGRNVLAVTVDAGEPARNVPRSVVDDGHRVIEMTPLDSALRIIVEKRK